MSSWRSERGAAAVEFVLVLPLLMLMVMGVIEFGRAYNAQISLTHAARETARAMAVSDNWSKAVGIGISAAPTLGLPAKNFTATSSAASPTPSPTSTTSSPTSTTSSAPSTTPKCVSGSMVTVTIAYELDTITGFLDNIDLEGKAAMRCGG